MVVEIREWKSTNFSIPVPVVYKLHLNILVSILSKKKKILVGTPVKFRFEMDYQKMC